MKTIAFTAVLILFWSAFFRYLEIMKDMPDKAGFIMGAAAGAIIGTLFAFGIWIDHCKK